jgi:hypothetical protein
LQKPVFLHIGRRDFYSTGSEIMTKAANQPLNVTLQAVFVLFITSWNAIRIYSALSNWQILSEFGAQPIYLLATGLGWTLASLWLFRQLWEGRRMAQKAALALAGLYFLWYWVDRLVIQPSPAPNLLFSSVFSTVILAIFTLNLFLPVSKAFFKKE